MEIMLNLSTTLCRRRLFAQEISKEFVNCGDGAVSRGHPLQPCSRNNLRAEFRIYTQNVATVHPYPPRRAVFVYFPRLAVSICRDRVVDSYPPIWEPCGITPPGITYQSPLTLRGGCSRTSLSFTVFSRTSLSCTVVSEQQVLYNTSGEYLLHRISRRTTIYKSPNYNFYKNIYANYIYITE